ncbi:MAG TPA: DUF192 domain-containing protein [Luteimonas sp.]|nr:DUF192 domain-containing protein [Luteimonas sp.]
MRCGRIERGDAPPVARAWRAERWWQRLRGLLFRPALSPDGSEALVIVPCASVHTFGMAYPLDLVFLDREGRVCGWREALAPWRMAGCRGARATVELHGGTLARLAPRMGEAWTWQPR